MNPFVLIVLTMLATTGVIAILYCTWTFVQHTKLVESHNAEVMRMLSFIAKGHQLSTIFDIKSAMLGVTPEQFAPNVETVRADLLRLLETQKHPDPNTWAWCIVNHSGLKPFTDYDTRSKAEEALARLRANGDMEGARAFVSGLVDQLSAPVAIVH